MPIQSYTLEIAGGHAVVRAYDQDGEQHMFSFFTAGVADMAVLVGEKIAALNVALADTEFAKIVGAD